MKKILLLVCFTFFAIFSAWLMWRTLNYDSNTGAILVSAKYWSDFGGHLPQIRSFSLGQNWPPEYPLFPGEPIRYHFLFFYLVGLLEKSGIRLDWALNLPSSLGFFALLLMIYVFSKKMFQKTSVALLSVLFFLFNSSFSWLDLLRLNKFNLLSTLTSLPRLTQYPSFGPWNGSSIAAFWNLNVYTNQRHLSLSFVVVLVILYLLKWDSSRRLYLVGFLLGFLLLINQAAFVIVCIFAPFLLLTRPKTVLPFTISLLGAIPWFIFQFLYVHASSHIFVNPWFLFSGHHSPLNILSYWLQNFGFHVVLIPISFLFVPRRSRVFILPMVVLFALPNIFQLSVDMINNHKFFNFFLILCAMFSAYFVYRLSHIKFLGKVIAPMLILLLTLGGIVDIFPVLNDFYYRIPDVVSNPDAIFFNQHTAKKSVVLNSTWFYHPASLAGRKIFNGYSYFTWSFGYDQVNRENVTIDIYRATTKTDACSLLSQNHIDYVELSPNPEPFIRPNTELWETNFIPSYTNNQTGLKIFSVSNNCI